MQLYLVRHADATPGNPDELRPLSDVGHEQAREFDEIAREYLAPDRVKSGSAAPASRSSSSATASPIPVRATFTNGSPANDVLTPAGKSDG